MALPALVDGRKAERRQESLSTRRPELDDSSAVPLGIFLGAAREFLPDRCFVFPGNPETNIATGDELLGRVPARITVSVLVRVWAPVASQEPGTDDLTTALTAAGHLVSTVAVALNGVVDIRVPYMAEVPTGQYDRVGGS